MAGGDWRDGWAVKSTGCSHKQCVVTGFQRTLVTFPAPTWWLTTVCNCSSRVADVHLCPLRVLHTHGMQTYIHPGKHSYPANNISKKQKQKTNQQPTNKANKEIGEWMNWKSLLAGDRVKPQLDSTKISWALSLLAAVLKTKRHRYCTTFVTWWGRRAWICPGDRMFVSFRL